MAPTRYPSPGIYVNEFDKTIAPPTVERLGPTTLAVGVFSKGPVSELTPIRSLKELIDTFGYPTEENRTSWFHIKAALDYGGTPLVWRLSDADQVNAYDNLDNDVTIKNNSDFFNQYDELVASVDLNNDEQLGMVARTPGSWGNSVVVAVNLPLQYVTLSQATHRIRVGATQLEDIPNYIQRTRSNSTISLTFRDDSDPPATVGNGTYTIVWTEKDGSSYDIYIRGAEFPLGTDSITVSINSVVIPVTNFIGVSPYAPTIGDSVENPRTSNISFINDIITSGDSSTIILRHPVAENSRALLVSGVYFLSTVVTQNRVIPYAKDTFGLPVTWASVGGNPSTTYFGKFNEKFGDGISIAIVDKDGKISGRAGTILELYTNLSTAVNASNQYGLPISFIERINQQSKYVYFIPGTNLNPYGYDSSDNASVNPSWISDYVFNGVDLDDGTDVYVDEVDYGISLTEDLEAIKDAYYNLTIQDTYNVDYILPFVNYRALLNDTENETFGYTNLINYILEEVCEVTKKSILVISPPQPYVTDNPNHVNESLSFRGELIESSFGYYIHEWVYLYDQYNRTFFWQPGASEVIGACLRNQFLSRNFLSPAGFVRGNLINGIKLSNPTVKADRDRLYVNQINSIITDAGRGFVLYGDKTLLTYDSFFNRVNVRKVIIEIHKEGAELLRPYLFGVNNAFTRSQVENDFIRYLNGVLNDNGISAFRVQCNSDNNPQEVIDNNELIVDVTVRPTLSINFITLNITADRNLIQITEVVL